LVAAWILEMLIFDFGIVGVAVECYDDGIGAGMPALERVSASVGAFAAVVSQAACGQKTCPCPSQCFLDLPLKALCAARARKPPSPAVAITL